MKVKSNIKRGSSKFNKLNIQVHRSNMAHKRLYMKFKKLISKNPSIENKTKAIYHYNAWRSQRNYRQIPEKNIKENAYKHANKVAKGQAKNAFYIDIPGIETHEPKGLKQMVSHRRYVKR